MKGDEDIIIALNHCANVTTDIHKCVDCPLFGHYTDCTQRLINGANELITRLTARNTRLKKKNRELKENRDNGKE